MQGPNPATRRWLGPCRPARPCLPTHGQLPLSTERGGEPRKRSPLQRVRDRRRLSSSGDVAGHRVPSYLPGCSPGRNTVPGHCLRRSCSVRAALRAPRTPPLRPQSAGNRAAEPLTPEGGQWARSAGSQGRGRADQASQRHRGLRGLPLPAKRRPGLHLTRLGIVGFRYMNV